MATLGSAIYDRKLLTRFASPHYPDGSPFLKIRMPSIHVCERAWAEVRRVNPKQANPKQKTAELFALYLETRSTLLRNQISLINQGLVVAIAERYAAHCSLPLEDLIQLGHIGLIRAIEKFDPAEGVAFSSFAVPYIKGEMQHFQRDKKNLAKVPRRWQETSDSARMLQSKLAKAGRADLSLDEVAHKGLNLPPDQWKAIHQATQSQVWISLDEENHDLAATPGLSLEAREQIEAMQDAAIAALDSLPELERACLLERFWGELGEDVIGKRHRISTVEVQQAIASGLQHLREIAAV